MGLKFGTSGLRGLVTEMTDKECYVNTKGYIKFLESIKGVKDRVAIAGDLRESTRRILKAVAKAIIDCGYEVIYCGRIPTPTLTYYAMKNNIPSVMVTGSHIPFDRNGVKYIKIEGEVLKEDEKPILDSVEKVRLEESYLFDEKDMFKEFDINLIENKDAKKNYIERYVNFFGNCLIGKKIVLYEHTAVGRNLIKELFMEMGAEVVCEERSSEFVHIDTEKVSGIVEAKLKNFSMKHNPDAIISTDGDSDRPLLADENGRFLPGDKLGVLCCKFLKPDFAAITVSSNDAVCNSLESMGIKVVKTRIGSPYVIDAMNKAEGKTVSWEANGGFLTGCDFIIQDKKLEALPTRDAVLPLVIALVLGRKLSEVIEETFRGYDSYSEASYIENNDEGCEQYTAEMGKRIVKSLTPQGKEVDFRLKARLESYFSKEIVKVNYVDGFRVYFSDGEVIHLRPSGNAPQFRIYSVGRSPERAREIIEETKKIIPLIIKDFIK
ncbi:phosphomannomutase [archaeon]|jgi:phosphomannomutase|nr:phosphomannomutase [archaeon]MBT4396958.1 phosphomannomutase [archaeon]MBT4440949.1 phosphomannomutase [archaeon]